MSERTRHVRRATVIVTAMAAVCLAFAGPAGATGGHGGGQGGGSGGTPSAPIIDGLAGPLALDVSAWGDVLIGQSFGGLVTKVSRQGRVEHLVSGEETGAVGWGPFGTVVYSSRNDAGSTVLKVRMPWGATKVLADLGAYEASVNPDGPNHYGFVSIPADCAEQWPEDELGPAQYTGQVDSNPYALAVTHGGVYVADAGANAILFVDWRGRVSTVSVLPPQPQRLPDATTTLDLPACVAGLTYAFEPVPTDIELAGRGGFVSLLPGGPEDASFGARGSVVKLDLRSGVTRPVATGLLGATDLAISPRGDIYVAELFGNRVSKVTRNGPTTVAELVQPATVEWSAGRLFVSFEVFGSGKVSAIRVGG